ncbi:MAG: aldehyde dehydrogenase family protein [Bdellovibrionota bacterium]
MLKIVNPANESVLRELEEDNAKSVADKFARAAAAQKTWARTPLETRVAAIRKFREILARDIEKLALILTQEVGKPLSQSRNEINGTMARLDFFVENVAGALRDRLVWKDPEQKIEERIRHEPLGVIANISAWNYPYFVGSNVFLPALLVGNALLYKPSEFSTLTGLAIAERLHEAGIPKDVFIPLVGGGAVGVELLKQKIAGVFFTGSYATGKKIAEAVAGRMIKVQLELGGKDPVYIADDVADVKGVAAGTADGAFYNNGQSCCSVERIYVHEKIYDRFVEEFVAEVKGFVVGDPTDAKTYIGPLTRGAQVGVIERQIADAKAKGGKVLTGGARASGRSGHYFEPTVLVNVNHTMELMREESFGPLIGIMKVRDDAEALKLMNDTEYGLTAGVYTRDRVRAEKMLAELNAGSAYWNCCDRVSPRLPWSGRGHSGIGATLSTYGIETFLQPKGWHLRG